MTNNFEMFLERMQNYLGPEYEAFEASLEQPFLKSLRINPKKADPEFLKEALKLTRPSRFYPHSFLVDGSYGLSLQHLQGLFYLQEPSASSVVGALHLEPDDLVLDLCAAPGSKTTQIVSELGGGFLLCNELVEKRMRVLAGNLERMGAVNYCLTHLDAKALCRQVPDAFDKILVDAPCSGEGMIKKHEAAVEQWSLQLVLECQKTQKHVLKAAYEALAKDGELVYSTCTYSLEENEQVVAWFLEQFDDCIQIDVDLPFGRPGFKTEGMDEKLVRRIFPMDGGEGHFIARFKKLGGTRKALPILPDQKVPALAKEFLNLNHTHFENYFTRTQKKDIQVFGMNHPFLDLKGVVHQGVHIGTIKKNRFEPAHSFYLAETFRPDNGQYVECTIEEADAFFHGSELKKTAPKGYVALCYQSVPFGFGKSSSGRITNKLPKGLRIPPGAHVYDSSK